MAEAKKKWDLTSTGSLWGAAEWIRKQGDALFVLVVRVDDMAFSVADGLAPADVVTMVKDELPALEEMLRQYRAAQLKRPAAERSIEAAR
jgi:hypothetical protein